MSEDGAGTGGFEGWFRELSSGVPGIVEHVRREFAALGRPPESGAASDEESAWARWSPVASAARDVAVHLAELGRYVWMADEEIDVAERLEQLNRRIVGLVARFPDVATLYDDVDRLDRWLDRRTLRHSPDAPLWTYLSWVEGVVDGIVRRVVDYSFGTGDSRILSPDRAAAFLDRFDAVLRQVLERWMRDLDLRPDDEGESRGEAPDPDDTGEGEEAGP